MCMTRDYKYYAAPKRQAAPASLWMPGGLTLGVLVMCLAWLKPDAGQVNAAELVVAKP